MKINDENEKILLRTLENNNDKSKQKPNIVDIGMVQSSRAFDTGLIKLIVPNLYDINGQTNNCAAKEAVKSCSKIELDLVSLATKDSMGSLYSIRPSVAKKLN